MHGQILRSVFRSQSLLAADIAWRVRSVRRNLSVFRLYVRDNRYFSGVPFDEFAESLKILNKKGVDYLISYDGECGGKEYGEDLPEDLKCKKVMLNAGLSSQALLLGKKQTTFEALYISEALIQEIDKEPEQLSFMEAIG